MASYSLLLIILVLFVVNVDSRRFSRKHQLRLFYRGILDKIKNKTINKFHFDERHFDKEQTLLFPDVGFQLLNNDSTWKVVVHGWRYQGNKKRDWFGLSASRWIERIAKHMLNEDAILYLNGSLNHDRLKPFFVEDEFNDMVSVKIGEKSYTLRTDQYGQIYDQIEVTNDEIQKLKKQQTDDVISYEATGDNQDTAKGIIRLIEPREGISIISDVDDTIKISEVLDKVRLIANTFIHAFKAVPGMADLYQKWRSNNKNLTFHYLSGMPDQLYALTQEFIITNNFPDGSFHMRHFGWAAQSLFNFLHSQATFAHKITYLRFFFSNTIRSYVLVGDSGEKDPEIYGTIAREYPNRIRAIFIRAIKGEKFDDQRFLDAFLGVSQEKWQIFDDPQQLPTDLSRPPRAPIG